ncbi:MAG: hypothetical protein R3E13_11580 [Alphaproteobacteria bacterium]
MNIKQKIKSGINALPKGKALLAVLPLVIICGFVIARIGDGHNPAKASLLENEVPLEQKTFAALSGFEPGAIVVYSVFSEDGDMKRATSVVDQHGYLNIAVPESLENAGSDIIYDFSVSEQNRTLSLLLKVDADTGAVAVKGQGAEPFTGIEIAASGSNIRTRTDWAGLFEETGIRGGEKNEKGNPVQVAFYSRDIASDARAHQSPSVIKVFTAPGGGGADGSGINVWSESNCSPPVLSTCYTATVDAQNQKIIDNYVTAFFLMTEQLAAISMQPVQAIGMFFDAKLQLQTQRLHQKLKAEAVKDYHPSNQMCRIGTYVRSLATVEEKAAHDQIALNDILMETQENRYNMSSALGPESYISNRLAQFKELYCDTSDNNGGLEILCDDGNGAPGAADQTRVNKDIDYARTVEFPYTLDVDFTNDVISDEETDVIALARNLYWTDAFSFVTGETIKERAEYFQRTRQHMALNNLAHASYTKLISMKAHAPNPPAGEEPGWAHMKSMMREFGLSDIDIENMIGENPSYHAQMEIMTKKIYQDPDFYTNLYDKPTNVDRINASLEAIGLMQQRDHYEAALRREMLLSGMLEAELITDAEKLQGQLLELK